MSVLESYPTVRRYVLAVLGCAAIFVAGMVAIALAISFTDRAGMAVIVGLITIIFSMRIYAMQLGFFEEQGLIS